jgi:hypothetical protein
MATPAPNDPNETVEITRGQLAQLQRGYSLLDKLYSGKDTSTAFKRMAKQADPDGKLIKVADIDLADELTKPINDKLTALEEDNKKLRASIDEDKKQRKDDADLFDINTRIDLVVKKRGLTDEGRKGLIETMQKRQIADPDAAAAVYLESIPKPDSQRPSSILPQRLGKWDGSGREPFAGHDDEKIKKFFADPEAAADEEIANILNEAAA